MSRAKYVEKTVKWAEAAGFENIKANLEGYESPFFYERKQDNEKFSPDATGVNKDRKYFFHLALKNDLEAHHNTNLILLDELARMKGSKLYIMAPTGHLKYARELVLNSKLETAEIVKI